MILATVLALTFQAAPDTLPPVTAAPRAPESPAHVDELWRVSNEPGQKPLPASDSDRAAANRAAIERADAARRKAGEGPNSWPAAGETGTASGSAGAQEDDRDWGVSDYLDKQRASAAGSDLSDANRAAIERAEAARREGNAPSAWESQSGRRCRSTPNGFVCGTSEKARKQSETLLNNMLNRPD